MDPVPDPILPEKFVGYSLESNPGPLGWQSDVQTAIPNRWSSFQDEEIILTKIFFLIELLQKIFECFTSIPNTNGKF